MLQIDDLLMPNLKHTLCTQRHFTFLNAFLVKEHVRLYLNTPLCSDILYSEINAQYS